MVVLRKRKVPEPRYTGFQPCAHKLWCAQREQLGQSSESPFLDMHARRAPVCSVSAEDSVERLLAAAANCSSLVIFTGSGVSATSGPRMHACIRPCGRLCSCQIPVSHARCADPASCPASCVPCLYACIDALQSTIAVLSSKIGTAGQAGKQRM